MPKLNGLDFSKTLPASIKVVFTTAYDQYALDGFRLNALDYLLKPISYADFLSASQRALDWFELTNSSSEKCIYVKSGYRVIKIDLASILYIENQKDYVEFYLEGSEEPIRSLMGLQFLEEKLPKKSFMRIHRSYIVNLSKVKIVERNCILFDKKYIPVSESYRKEFNDFLNQRIL